MNVKSKTSDCFFYKELWNNHYEFIEKIDFKANKRQLTWCNQFRCICIQREILNIQDILKKTLKVSKVMQEKKPHVIFER